MPRGHSLSRIFRIFNLYTISSLVYARCAQHITMMWLLIHVTFILLFCFLFLLLYSFIWEKLFLIFIPTECLYEDSSWCMYIFQRIKLAQCFLFLLFTSVDPGLKPTSDRKPCMWIGFSIHTWLRWFASLGFSSPHLKLFKFLLVSKIIPLVTLVMLLGV